MTITKLFRRLYYGRGIPNLSRMGKAFPEGLIRAYAEEDFDACCDIHDCNEKNRIIPGKVVHHFQDYLKKGDSAKLVFVIDDKIVGTGGLSLYNILDDIIIANLSYGLVHPDYQGRGIGTALLITRLSLLSSINARWIVVMSNAGLGTQSFYTKFGFQFTGRIPWVDGIEMDHYLLIVPRGDNLRFRRKLNLEKLMLARDIYTPLPVIDYREEYQKELQKKQRGS